jgi:hypothetical protein
MRFSYNSERAVGRGWELLCWRTQKHKHCKPRFGWHYLLFGKAGTNGGPARAVIVACRIDGDNGCSLGEELLSHRAQKCTAVSAIQHGWLADEGIYDLRSGLKMREMRLGPCNCRIDLNVREWTLCVLDNPLLHQRLIEILCNQSKLLLRISPPPDDLRCSQPTSNHRQVFAGERPEIIGWHGLGSLP